MSGPYRFHAESSRSPLDSRPQNPLPAQQPVSFKTNVNRAKTKKWVEAKKNAYDGDDWGEYDEYDEYGASEPETVPLPAHDAASQARGSGQRNFTEPQRQVPPLQSGRRNSFEAGEEQRAFSASMGSPPPGLADQHAHQSKAVPLPQPPEHAALRDVADPDLSATPEPQKDSSPSAIPAPLQTRMPPGPITSSGSPTTQFPPRKSSISQAEPPAATSPRDRAPSNPGKPLPFIRPADIYKRHAEERELERASLDEQRPSVEATPERGPVRSQQPVLPPVKEGVARLNDDDLRSVVDSAFTRGEDSRSVPPTPFSNNDSGVPMSNTNSTSGISSTISRVPGSAVSAIKAGNFAGGGSSTPVLAEESSESNNSVSRPASATLFGGTRHIPPNSSHAHSHNISDSSPVLSGPTKSHVPGSPVHSHAIEPQTHAPEPGSVHVSSPVHATTALKVPTAGDATAREVDMAEEMKMSPFQARPEFSAAEQEAQTTFLESHPPEKAPRSRSESPSKGRVQELAGKFGEVTHSRRGSTQSISSGTSLQSWEKSGENSRPASPMKIGSSKEETGIRPAAERGASFRPKLPGQWESFATTAGSPDKRLSIVSLPDTNNDAPSPLEQVDLTPTTAKHPASLADPAKSTADPLANPLAHPLAALKAAGAAIGEAIQSSNGGDPSPADGLPREKMQGGVVVPRPLHMYRQESSVSTVPPTPPAKDTPEHEMPPPPPLKERDPETRPVGSGMLPERPATLPHLSTDTAVDDQESDRLRKEIVASLSPQQATTTFTSASDSASAHTGSRPVDGKNNLWTESSDNVTKPAILTRFSWEDRGSSLALDKSQQTSTTTAPNPAIKTMDEEKMPAPAAEKVVEEQEPDGFSNPYFGPTHGAAVARPEPLKDADLIPRSQIVDPSSPRVSSLLAEGNRSASPVQGLHVVNSALNPEAVDLPPRLSHEVSPVSDPARQSQDMSLKDAPAVNHGPTQGPIPNSAISAPLHDIPGADPVSPTAMVSPTSDKPLGFKDILQLKSPVERISHYNKTREYWARADHGLGDWVSVALTTNPGLATEPYPQLPLKLNTAGTIRHKPTGSLSLFGKHHGTSSSQAETANVPASQPPTTPISGSNPQGGGKSASLQMQAKGKDLLHTAGVLSGKGMTGAKGLFAKGKSRFRSDKVDK